MNEIRLYGPIGPGGITAQMVKHQLAKADQSQPLVVRIDSDGGSVFDGLSMYQAFAAYPGPKRAIVEPTAFSIASYIAMAFDDVEIAGNGYLMIHAPMIDQGGTARELRASADTLDQLRQTMVDAYVRKSRQPRGKVEAMLDAETFLSATEAKALGFVDSIAGATVTRMTPAAMARVPARICAKLQYSGANVTARERFEAVVQTYKAQGLNRQRAVASAVAADPALHRSMLREANADRPAVLKRLG